MSKHVLNARRSQQRGPREQSAKHSAYIRRIDFGPRSPGPILHQVTAVTILKKENVMKPELKREKLIDLGVASIETKGATVGKDDSQGGRIALTGLGDE
jgi:hypothetical protein